MSKYLAWYQGHLARRPIATQLVSTGILFAAGDILAQQGVEQRGLFHHDFSRTSRMAFFGFAMAGPVMIGWFRTLDRFVHLASPNRTLLARVALDQGVFAPINIAYFFTAQGVLEGKGFEEIGVKLNEAYGTTLLANWKVWPLVQLLNFKFVPLEHRLLVVNVVALAWNCVLSSINAGSSQPVKQMQTLQID